MYMWFNLQIHVGDSLDKGERNGVPHATTVLPTQVLSGVPDRESRLSMAPVQTVDQGQQKGTHYPTIIISCSVWSFSRSKPSGRFSIVS